MLEVQKYLKEKGLDSLVNEFHIKANEYDNIVVLNYDQIESPRFNSICDECRSLILEKDTWNVISYPFQRFYNTYEGFDFNSCKVIDPVRVASLNKEPAILSFPIEDAIIENKLDGSICTIWNYNGKWNCSTRSMAFAEGSTTLGRTFSQVFEDAVKKTKLYSALETIENAKDFCYTFELTSPETRVTTPFSETKITLIGARHLKEETNYRELSRTELFHLAQLFNVDRPKTYTVKSYKELIEMVEKFNCMDEGVVLVWEMENGSHIRSKCKNPAFVAISNMRNNGAISPRRILTLVMANEQHEYLKYFECDSKYVSFVEEEYNKSKERIKTIYNENRNLVNQKDFALAIMPKTVYSFEQGVIFTMRKKNEDVEKVLKDLGSDKIAKGMNLKGLFVKKFGLNVEDDK